jgi:hypothetical protein
MPRKLLRTPFAEPTVDLFLRVPPELAKWITDEARTLRVTKTKFVCDCLRSHQTIQQQLAESVVLGPAEVNGKGPHLVHVLLTRLKEELAQSIDGQSAAVQHLTRHLQVLQTMLDRAYYGFLLHTEPVPEEKRPHRKAEAQRRYERWVEEVTNATHAPTAPRPRH